MTKEQLVKILKSRKWWIQVFNGLPLYLHTVASNTGWMIKRVCGVNYSHFFLSIKQSRAHYYYDEADLAAIGDGYYKKYKSIAEVKPLVAKHKHDYQTIRQQNGLINDSRLAKLSLREILNLSQKLCRELTMAIGVTHAIEGISFVSEIKLTEILDKRNLNSQDNFQLLSSPTKLSFLSEAQIKLWAIKQSQGKKQTTLTQHFLKNYGWIDNNYVHGKTLSAAAVLAKAKLQKTLPSVSTLTTTKTAKARLIKRLNLNQQELFVIQTIETCTAWQDDRKKFLMQTIGRLEPVVVALAGRVGLAVERFKYIYSRELTYKNLSDQNFLKKLVGRWPNSSYYALENQMAIFSGNNYSFIEKQLRQKKSRNITELSGMIACKGKIQGRVRLCRTIHDIAKVQRGEILVASMTRPEFLPAMQKAAAFVTDEGGITSHASIVSREMNKPCIIGTKIATAIFKNGDVVEVDANQGIVKKIL